MIRAELIETIRTANPLEDVASEQVALRRCGMQFRGRCQFHSERTPSFYVHPAKGLFHCYGCGVGGDVYAFVQKHLGCSFTDATKLLARRAGIVIDGWQPSPELTAKVRGHQADGEREDRFKAFCDERIHQVSDTYRHLGRAATHAERYLTSGLANSDPYIDDMAWDVIARYRHFALLVEHDGLADGDVLRAEWDVGSTVAAACTAPSPSDMDGTVTIEPGTYQKLLPPTVRHAVQKQIADLRSRLTPLDRERPVTIVLADRQNPEPAMARALALAVEGELCQVVLKDETT